jgi:hypothetical protein
LLGSQRIVVHRGLIYKAKEIEKCFHSTCSYGKGDRAPWDMTQQNRLIKSWRNDRLLGPSSMAETPPFVSHVRAEKEKTAVTPRVRQSNDHRTHLRPVPLNVEF